jgi:hypothetical protein
MNSNHLLKFGIENCMSSSPSLTCTPFKLLLVFIPLTKTFVVGHNSCKGLAWVLCTCPKIGKHDVTIEEGI